MIEFSLVKILQNVAHIGMMLASIMLANNQYRDQRATTMYLMP